MAQDITKDFGTIGSNFLSTVADSLADGSTSSATAAQEVGTSGVGAGEIVLELKLGGGTAGPVEVYLAWSADNTDFADTTNGELVHVHNNGTGATISVFAAEARARYFKAYVINQSGGALASSGNSLAFAETAIDQA